MGTSFKSKREGVGIRWDGELAHFGEENEGSFWGGKESMGPNDCVV